MKTLDVIAAALLIIGGLNWGLVGLFSFNLVAAIFGDMTIVSRIIYTIVGICALYWVVEWGAIRRRYGETAAGPGRQAPSPT
jgi:uncharacterized membrane protein YuzA (DUF378 family)